MQTIRAIAVVIFGVWNWQVTLAQTPIQDGFRSLEWQSPTSQRLYRYRLYVPDTEISGDKQPLILWLHGAAERGEDNLKNLRWMDLVFAAMNNRPHFLILVPQHASDEEWYAKSGSAAGVDDAVEHAHQILAQVITDYPVNPKRIYLAGVSSGGNACWELACRYPDLFAGIAPLASGGGNTSEAARLRHIPTWAFHVRTDQRPRPDGDRAMIRAIQASGGTALLTEVEANQDVELPSHNCWSAAIEDYQVLQWLLSQERGVPSSWVPGATIGRSIRLWLRRDAWISLVWFGLFLLVAFAAFRVRRHKRSRHSVGNGNDGRAPSHPAE